MDMMPSSQPVATTIEIIESTKRELEKYTKQILTLQSTDTQYGQCFEAIKRNILDLDNLNVTVGDLRLTKIGKYFSKLEHSLPNELSVIAAKVNNSWKHNLRNYREDFKRMLKNDQVFF